MDDDAIFWRCRLHNARDEEHRQSILGQIDELNTPHTDYERAASW
jgi:hypothetical protein